MLYGPLRVVFNGRLRGFWGGVISVASTQKKKEEKNKVLHRSVVIRALKATKGVGYSYS